MMRPTGWMLALLLAFAAPPVRSAGAAPAAPAGGDTLDTSTPAPQGMEGSADTSAQAAASGYAGPSEAIGPEPAPGGFMVPIDGDVFYDPDVRVLASLPTPPASMVLLLDGYAETNPLTVSEGLLTANLGSLKSGVHQLTLLLFNERTEIIERHDVRFFIRLPEPIRKAREGNYRQFGRVVAKVDWKNGEAKGRILSQSELKLAPGSDSTLVAGEAEAPVSQEVDGVTEGAYNLKYKQFEAYGKVLLRADENRFRQPSHRLTANVKYGPWVGLKAGDVYPLYNPLILNGTRVRGGEGMLSLTTGETTWGSFRAVRGETHREVPSYTVRYDTGSGTPRIDTVPGTFSQRMMAFRLGLGGGPKFDLGFTLMKASDVEGDEDSRKINRLLHGTRPMENAAGGFDLRVGVWDGRIQLYSNSGMSLFTKDKSLGSFSADTFDVAFDPKDWEDKFIFNSTTRGWQYLLAKKGGASTDVSGFIASNSAMESGIVTSIPFYGIVQEMELRYSHLGLEYHSEGNPFLGGNPGDGITVIEKLSVLENKVSVAMELGNYEQDLGVTSQVQRTLKVDLRFTPGPYNPSLWVGGGRSNIAPLGTYAHQFSSSFLNFNTGGYHQFQLSNAKLHTTLLYGFTQSEFALENEVPDTAGTAQDFPTTQTHIVNGMMQYKMRNVGFLPRVSYTFSHNGIQLPTNSVTLGFLQPLLDDKVRVDLAGTVGQYPESNDKNDVSVGLGANVEYVLGPQQTFRLREKMVQYGKRKHLLVGANYELFF